MVWSWNGMKKISMKCMRSDNGTTWTAHGWAKASACPLQVGMFCVVM